MEFENSFEQAATQVLADLGLNITQIPEWGTYEEAEAFTRKAVIHGLLGVQIERFVLAFEAERTGADDPDLFYGEADGVRYALWPYVGFEAALGLKDAAYAEAKRRSA